MKKRISSLLLVFCLCLSLLTVTAGAAGTPDVSGAYANGIVTVSGTSFPANTKYSMIAVKDASDNLIALGSAQTNGEGAFSTNITTGAVSTPNTCKVYVYNDIGGAVVASGLVSGTGVTTHTITASAGSGGTISPSGNVSVNDGASQTFTIMASSSYSISAVTVDGTSVGAVSTYTLSNVTANHTIAATFTYNGGGGSSSSGSSSSSGTVTGGSSASITAPTGGVVADSAISSAITSAGKGGEIIVNASSSTSATLSGAASTQAAANGSTLAVAVSGGGQITVTPAVLNGLGLKASDKVTVGMTIAEGSTASAPTFEVTLAVNGGAVHSLDGSMTVSFPLNAAWNGKNVVVAHTHADGSITFSSSTVTNGKAPVTIGDLSNFTVRLAADMPATAFNDVKAEDWFFGGIEYVVEKGLFNGTSATSFASGSPMTRQQMWMVLARLSGQTPADMNGAKSWAVSNGISDGSNPIAPVTRQQFVALLWRTVGSPKANGNLRAYSDASAVADYAKDAFAWAVESGAVSGTSATTLTPAGTATRAQIAVILSRYGQKTAQ